MEIEPKLGKSKFHGMIREVDLLRSRIAELEDQETDFREYLVKYFDIQQFDLYAENERLRRGPCKFNCRDKKGAFMAGWEFGVCAVSGSKLPFPEGVETAYKNWMKDRE